jgi:hypothetical protein
MAKTQYLSMNGNHNQVHYSNQVLLVWILGSVVYYFETNLKKDLFGWSI